MERFPIPSPHFSYTIGPSVVVGYYIYEWLDCHIPFYVGMGKTYRAWATHHPDTELRKELCTSFSVRIVKHHLSKSLAHKLERQRILARVRQGYSLTNKRIPTYENQRRPILGTRTRTSSQIQPYHGRTSS